MAQMSKNIYIFTNELSEPPVNPFLWIFVSFCRSTTVEALYSDCEYFPCIGSTRSSRRKRRSAEDTWRCEYVACNFYSLTDANCRFSCNSPRISRSRIISHGERSFADFIGCIARTADDTLNSLSNNVQRVHVHVSCKWTRDVSSVVYSQYCEHSKLARRAASIFLKKILERES